MTNGVFGPEYSSPLPPLLIDIRPDEQTNPEQWHAFRSAAALAVADLMEEFGFSARSGEDTADQ